jgi:O-acetyl-ADP-ribose deacetylase (regulator of RNase III)
MRRGIEGKMINYVIGDATYPIGDGPKIIAHVVNDVGAWGKGFVLAISKKWPDVKSRYLDLAKPLCLSSGKYQRQVNLRLGEVHLVAAEPGIWVANMVAQCGLISASNPIPLQLAALAECLAAVKSMALSVNAQGAPSHKSVHCPRISCGLGGSTWENVEPIIARELDGVDVYVYDLPGEER